MKKTRKTRLTARIFSVSVVAAAMLLCGCNASSTENVNDSPSAMEMPDSASDGIDTDTYPAAASAAEPVDLDTITEEELLQMTDDEFLEFALRFRTQERIGKTRTPDGLSVPAYWVFRPEQGRAACSIAELSAESRAEADRIAEERYQSSLKEYHTDGYPQFAEQKNGFWWYYDFGPRLGNLLVTDKAFLDFENRTLNAAVNEENMLRLAALTDFAGVEEAGAFVHDTGDALECIQYAVSVAEGDYNMADTALLISYTFSAEKTTGKLTGFWAESQKILRELEIPGSARSAVK